MDKSLLKIVSLFSAFCMGTVLQVDTANSLGRFEDVSSRRAGVSNFFEKQWANILIIDDDNDDKEKADNIIKAMVRDVDKNFGEPLEKYENGCVYKTLRNDKLRFIKFSYEEFDKLEKDKDYDAKYIVDSTSHIFYVFGKNSGLDHFKNFHDKFNRIWCGSDFDYDKEPYIPVSHDYRKWYEEMIGKLYDGKNTRDVFLFFGCDESGLEGFLEVNPGLKDYYFRMPGMENQLCGDANSSWEKLKVGYPNEALLYPRLPYDNYSIHTNSKIGYLIFRDQARIANKGGKVESHLMTRNVLLLMSTVLGMSSVPAYFFIKNKKLKHSQFTPRKLKLNNILINKPKQKHKISLKN